jgi:serine protease Do
MRLHRRLWQDAVEGAHMATAGTLTTFSNEIADVVAGAASRVVQVAGRRRPISGIVCAPDAVLTMARAIGREDGLSVSTDDGRTLHAEVAGWDPTTALAVLKVEGLNVAPLEASTAAARVGHVGIAIARSWSNALTASVGIVSVIGGPLPTGRRRAIEQVIRTTAPMHEGFAGGAFLDTSGRVIGVSTAMAIRGLGVVIPAAIAWRAATTLLERGGLKRGYLGISAQPAPLGHARRPGAPERGLLVVGITAGSPADAAGLVVGDVIASLDGRPLQSSQELFDVLSEFGEGRTIQLQVWRGLSALDVAVTLGAVPVE